MATAEARTAPLARPASRCVAIVAALALLLAACTAGPTPALTGLPGATTASLPLASTAAGSPAVSGGEPSARPGASAAPAGPAPAIQANIAVRVVVTTLNVRTSPSTSAHKAGAMAKGDVAILLGFGGIKANGYTWFQAARVTGLHGPLPPLPTYPLEAANWTDLAGWIAIASGATPWIVALPARCPTTVDLATLSAMLPGEQATCLGSTPLVLQGTFGCGGCGGTFSGTFTPEWLATPLAELFSVQPSVRIGPLQLYFPPGVTPPTEGQILRVRGHLNDPRSSTCVVAIPTTEGFDAKPVPLRAGDAATWCRQHVVVDGFDVLGVDPSFPPG
jgi:hypothetical protein